MRSSAFQVGLFKVCYGNEVVTKWDDDAPGMGHPVGCPPAAPFRVCELYHPHDTVPVSGCSYSNNLEYLRDSLIVAASLQGVHVLMALANPALPRSFRKPGLRQTLFWLTLAANMIGVVFFGSVGLIAFGLPLTKGPTAPEDAQYGHAFHSTLAGFLVGTLAAVPFHIATQLSLSRSIGDRKDHEVAITPDSAVTTAMTKLWSGPTLSVKAYARACSTLAQTCAGSGKATNREYVRAAGGLQAILAGLRTHRKTSSAVMAACEALRSLCATYRENSVTVAETPNGLATVAGVLADHLNDELAVTTACKALTDLTVGNDVARARVMACGGFRHIVAALDAHSDTSCAVVLACLPVIRNLTFVPEGRDMAVEAGVVPRLLHLLQRYPEDAAVVTGVTGSIQNMCVNSTPSVLALSAAGAIPVLAAVCQTHRLNVTIAMSVCATARNIGNCTPLRSQLAAAGLAPLLLDVLLTHSHRSLLVNAAGALRNMANDDSLGARAVAAANGVPTLVAALQRHVDQGAAVVAQVLAALLNVGKTLPPAVLRVAGSRSVVNLAMTRHATSQFVKTTGEAILRHMDESDDTCTPTADTGAGVGSFTLT